MNPDTLSSTQVVIARTVDPGGRRNQDTLEDSSMTSRNNGPVPRSRAGLLRTVLHPNRRWPR